MIRAAAFALTLLAAAPASAQQLFYVAEEIATPAEFEAELGGVGAAVVSWEPTGNCAALDPIFQGFANLTHYYARAARTVTRAQAWGRSATIVREAERPQAAREAAWRLGEAGGQAVLAMRRNGCDRAARALALRLPMMALDPSAGPGTAALIEERRAYQQSVLRGGVGG